MHTPTSEILRRIERYRPSHAPYKSHLTVVGTALRPYATGVIDHLKQAKTITLHESYYVHFLEICLDREGHGDLARALKSAFWTCRVTGAAPASVTHANVGIPGLPTVLKANWRFLPNPESMSAAELLRALRAHIAEHAGYSEVRFDLKRIEFALGLKHRVNIAVGTDEFYGYYAFLFPKDVVLFECPVHGNAAFVTRGDWQLLSQQYKAQLEGRARRIVHRRYWRADIGWALERLLGKPVN